MFTVHFGYFTGTIERAFKILKNTGTDLSPVILGLTNSIIPLAYFILNWNLTFSLVTVDARF